MKRKKRRVKSQKRQSTRPTTSISPSDNKKSRRDFLAILSNVGLFSAAGGGISWYLVDEVCATTREHDLTRIGNGIPSVVQIHDPECARCRALQGENRNAMSNFHDGELQYLVANIRQAKGRSFAHKNRVGNVTLLLFDGKGNRKGVLAGPNKAEHLTDIFRGHIARSSTR
jgi:hypothetical protein